MLSILAALAAAGVSAVLWRIVHIILGWAERRYFYAPIMSERVNSASDKFFIEDSRQWGKPRHPLDVLDDVASHYQ